MQHNYLTEFSLICCNFIYEVAISAVEMSAGIRYVFITANWLHQHRLYMVIKIEVSQCSEDSTQAICGNKNWGQRILLVSTVIKR